MRWNKTGEHQYVVNFALSHTSFRSTNTENGGQIIKPMTYNNLATWSYNSAKKYKRIIPTNDTTGNFTECPLLIGPHLVGLTRNIRPDQKSYRKIIYCDAELYILNDLAEYLLEKGIFTTISLIIGDYNNNEMVKLINHTINEKAQEEDELSMKGMQILEDSIDKIDQEDRYKCILGLELEIIKEGTIDSREYDLEAYIQSANTNFRVGTKCLGEELADIMTNLDHLAEKTENNGGLDASS